MRSITVTPKEHMDEGWRFIVDLKEGVDIYTYRISLSKQYYEQLKVDDEPEALIERVIRFLLQREGPQAILSEFSVKDVKTYFPDFESIISQPGL